MTRHAESVSAHYAREGLEQSVLDALEQAGKSLDALTRDDIAAMEEFHIRGREATREMARLAGLDGAGRAVEEEGAGRPVEDGLALRAAAVDADRPPHVLDIGCGIGGPARTLAAEFGCRVTAVDVVEAYCRLAELFTARLGLEDRVTFRHADALDLPFGGETFDIVWLQHTTMNVEDKRGLFREARRVLRPGGRVVPYEIMAGPGGEPHFPVPWAGDASINFLGEPDRVRALMRDLGYREREWRDVTAASLEWFRGVVATMANRPPDAPPPLGLNVLMGADAPVKAKNVIRNLEEDRIVVVQAVWERG